jgi:hypothetical protein
MPAITVVTTFHPKGLTQYGQRFIDTFSANVDQRIKLIVYAESCTPINPDPTRIKILDAQKELPKLNEFKKKWKNNPKANGIPPADIKARRPRDWHKKFKWDAIRFSNKVYAVFDACQKEKGWVVWIDADTVFHSLWSYEDFSKCLPNDHWITYVGRGKGSQTWPECGFYGLNLNHPVCHEFLKQFELMYEQAEQGIFTLEEWHDSYVFGHVLHPFKRQFPKALDYTADMMLRTAKTGGGGHPLINTILGQWIDHLKGDRKVSGKSLPKDLTVARTENYWR